MAQQVNECEIGVGTVPGLSAGNKMVHMEDFVVEQGLPTDRTQVVLAFGELPMSRGDRVDMIKLTLLPVGAQHRVIWRSRPFDEHMALDREPRELIEIASSGGVAKDPSVTAGRMQTTPIAGGTPVP